MAVGTERAAIRHWIRTESQTTPLADVVNAAVREALKEVDR